MDGARPSRREGSLVASLWSSGSLAAVHSGGGSEIEERQLGEAEAALRRRPTAWPRLARSLAPARLEQPLVHLDEPLTATLDRPPPMSSRPALRLPPLRYLAAGLAALFLVVHLAAVHNSDAYARHASVDSLRSKLGLGSDGMAPVDYPRAQGHGGAAAPVNSHDWAAQGAVSPPLSLSRCSSTARLDSGPPALVSADLVLPLPPSPTSLLEQVNSTRANAAFVILARNSDVWEILKSIRGIEGPSHLTLSPWSFVAAH